MGEGSKLQACAVGLAFKPSRKEPGHVPLSWRPPDRHRPASPFAIFPLIPSTVESSSCRTFVMAAPQVHHLFHAPIADHSFSSDRQTLAVARENNVELYQSSGNKFSLSDELKGHEKTVTSVDIAPNSGRIVTCSQGMLNNIRTA